MHASYDVKQPVQPVSSKRQATVSVCYASAPARGGESTSARLGECANAPRGLLQRREPRLSTEKRALQRNDPARLGARDRLSAASYRARLNPFRPPSREDEPGTPQSRAAQKTRVRVDGFLHLARKAASAGSVLRPIRSSFLHRRVFQAASPVSFRKIFEVLLVFAHRRTARRDALPVEAWGRWACAYFPSHLHPLHHLPRILARHLTEETKGPAALRGQVAPSLPAARLWLALASIPKSSERVARQPRCRSSLAKSAALLFDNSTPHSDATVQNFPAQLSSSWPNIRAADE